MSLPVPLPPAPASSAHLPLLHWRTAFHAPRRSGGQGKNSQNKQPEPKMHFWFAQVPVPFCGQAAKRWSGELMAKVIPILAAYLLNEDWAVPACLRSSANKLLRYQWRVHFQLPPSLAPYQRYLIPAVGNLPPPTTDSYQSQSVSQHRRRSMACGEVQWPDKDAWMHLVSQACLSRKQAPGTDSSSYWPRTSPDTSS